MTMMPEILHEAFLNAGGTEHELGSPAEAARRARSEQGPARAVRYSKPTTSALGGTHPTPFASCLFRRHARASDLCRTRLDRLLRSRSLGDRRHAALRSAQGWHPSICGIRRTRCARWVSAIGPPLPCGASASGLGAGTGNSEGGDIEDAPGPTEATRLLVKPAVQRLHRDVLCARTSCTDENAPCRVRVQGGAACCSLAQVRQTFTCVHPYIGERVDRSREHTLRLQIQDVF
ncbi:hypothetical protein OH77DRAFT_625806 [Trametes cingulata]|nr:hypothetical protein OH77DRAFT_625806 [Trametes cingulata]